MSKFYKYLFPLGLLSALSVVGAEYLDIAPLYWLAGACLVGPIAWVWGVERVFKVACGETPDHDEMDKILKKLIK